MNGFLKRDFYLIRGNLRFYLIFMVAFGVLMIVSDAAVSFLSLYVVVFGMSSVMGLFSYDDMNHWAAYGSAIPAGRMAMVDARYLLTVLIAAGVLAIQLVMGLLGQEEGILPMTAVYCGVFLLYAAVTLPVSYHFGGTKARTVMILIVAVTAGLGAVAVTTLQLSSSFGRVALPAPFLVLPLVGIAALAVSWRCSVGIMERKEL